MAWDFADNQLRDGVQKLLNERRNSVLLQTGYLQVDAKDGDTLIITRYAAEGLDVFGEKAEGEKVTVRVSRK